jgi:excisionase family DNA binding protein
MSELEKVLDIFSALIAAKVTANLRNLPSAPPVKLLNISQVAAMTGRSKSSIQHLIARDEIPAVRIGRRVQVRPEDLQEWIRRNQG